MYPKPKPNGKNLIEKAKSKLRASDNEIEEA